MGKKFNLLLSLLYVFVPAAFVAEFVLHNLTLVFLFSALGIVPLAKLMGHATEAIATRVGSGLGAFLNAALGNAAELIICFVAMSKGLDTLVKASITGSIIGNILFILGLSMFLGGLKRENQTFSQIAAESGIAMLFVAVGAICIPSIVEKFSPEVPSGSLFKMSVWTCGIILIVYVAGLFFAFKTHKHIYDDEEEEAEVKKEPIKRAIVELIVSAVFISFLAEFLCGSVEHAAKAMNLSQLFVGVIVVAIVGNAAEHAAAVTFAIKNKMNLAVGIAIESSKQIALFVAPVIVLSSLFFPTHIDLTFTGFEAAAMLLSVLILALVALDGKSNWLEGVQLLAIYAILAVAFWFATGTPPAPAPASP